jgi:hypothetical protein
MHAYVCGPIPHVKRPTLVKIKPIPLSSYSMIQAVVPASRLGTLVHHAVEHLVLHLDPDSIIQLAKTCIHLYTCIMYHPHLQQRLYLRHYLSCSLDDQWLWLRLRRVCCDAQAQTMVASQPRQRLPRLGLWARLFLERWLHEKRWVSAYYWIDDIILKTEPQNTHTLQGTNIRMLAADSEHVLIINNFNLAIYVIALEPICPSGLESTVQTKQHRVIGLPYANPMPTGAHCDASALINDQLLVVTIWYQDANHAQLIVWQTSDYQIVHQRSFSSEIKLLDLRGTSLLYTRASHTSQRIFWWKLGCPLYIISAQERMTLSIPENGHVSLCPQEPTIDRRRNYRRWLQEYVHDGHIPSKDMLNATRAELLSEPGTSIMYQCLFEDGVGILWRAWSLESMIDISTDLHYNACKTRANTVKNMKSECVDHQRVLLIGTIPSNNKGSDAIWIACHHLSTNTLAWEVTHTYAGQPSYCILEDRGIILVGYQGGIAILSLNTGLPLRQTRTPYFSCCQLIRLIGAWCLATTNIATRFFLIHVETGRLKKLQIPDPAFSHAQCLTSPERLLYKLRGVVKRVEFDKANGL